jgi:hypothetical protein
MLIWKICSKCPCKIRGHFDQHGQTQRGELSSILRRMHTAGMNGLWTMGSIMNRTFLGTYRPRKASSKNKLFGDTSDRDKFDIAP